MCTSKGKIKAAPQTVEVPETPETLKRPAGDAAAIRVDAQRIAAQRFGAMATDLTRGSLGNGKKRTTGGD